jgi:hypothetical protein
MAKEPFLGVPSGEVRVENPDGIYLSGVNRHNLYDSEGPLPVPMIPGDYEVNRAAENLRRRG